MENQFVFYTQTNLRDSWFVSQMFEMNSKYSRSKLERLPKAFTARRLKFFLRCQRVHFENILCISVTAVETWKHSLELWAKKIDLRAGISRVFHGEGSRMLKTRVNLHSRVMSCRWTAKQIIQPLSLLKQKLRATHAWKAIELEFNLTWGFPRSFSCCDMIEVNYFAEDKKRLSIDDSWNSSEFLNKKRFLESLFLNLLTFLLRKRNPIDKQEKSDDGVEKSFHRFFFCFAWRWKTISHRRLVRCSMKRMKLSNR